MAIRALSTALLFSIGCAMDTSEPSLCDQASETLERCTGSVPDGFRDACAANPDTVASGVLAEADAESCVSSGKADGLVESEFVGSCAALVNAAYWVVWARSPKSEPLSSELREQLRPWYGNLVDTIRVSWNSDLLTHWRVLGHDVVLDEDLAAQTFGNEIFVRLVPENDLEMAVLIGHELQHGAQYRAFGGVTGFARKYCAAFYDANFSYQDNPLEVEAYDRQDQIRSCLDYGSDCP